MKSIWDQPDAVDYVDDEGKPRKHTFDFLATLHCGRRIAYPVKPDALVEKSGIQRVLELIREQVGSKFADAYVLRTDEHITKARVANAKLIISSLDCRNDEHVARVRECMAGVVGSVLIADVAARSGLEGHAVRAIACLIWDGVLQLARPGLIDQRAFITPVRAAAAA